jgi:hypothetical protein
MRYVLIQVTPARVHSLDFAELPIPFPFFHTQFSQTRFLQIIMRLVPNQQSAIIVSRKSVYPPVSMLEYSGDKVGGYAQIERSITPTGHDVDKSSFRPFGPSGLLPSQEHVAFLCSCEGRNLVE